MDNFELFNRLKLGKAEALNQAYNQYFRKMQIFCCSYVKNSSVAEDIVQDAFLSLWEKRESLQANTHIGAYLLTLVKNKAINYIRHEQVKVKAENIIKTNYEKDLDILALSLDACDPEYLFSREVENIVAQSLDLLGEKTRQVIILSRFENKSNAEIAEILGITLKGVEFHITKGLKFLRQNLKDYLVFLLYFV